MRGFCNCVPFRDATGKLRPKWKMLIFCKCKIAYIKLYQTASRKIPRRKRSLIRDRLIAAGLTVLEKVQCERGVSPQHATNEFIERCILSDDEQIFIKYIAYTFKRYYFAVSAFFRVQSNSLLQGVSPLLKNHTRKSRETFSPLNPKKFLNFHNPPV